MQKKTVHFRGRFLYFQSLYFRIKNGITTVINNAVSIIPPFFNE